MTNVQSQLKDWAWKIEFVLHYLELEDKFGKHMFLENNNVCVCRSSPWTPPWADEDWIYFINILYSLFPDQFRHGIKLDYVMMPRKFDFEVAKKFRMERLIDG